MTKFSNFKIKWPKPVEKVKNEQDRSPPPKFDPPPQKKGPLDPPVPEYFFISIVKDCTSCGGTTLYTSMLSDKQVLVKSLFSIQTQWLKKPKNKYES